MINYYKKPYFGAAVFFACLFLLIFFAVAVFGWNNPSADPPGGAGAIAVDASGNVGINTSAPAGRLDVNGTSFFRGVVNANNNRVTGVAAPSVSSDAVNKNYVDSQTGGSNSSKVWGEGRKNVSVENTAGECVVSGVKVSRSSHAVEWSGNAAACPAGWWVCSVANRGSGSCGSGVKDWLNCSGVTNGGGPTGSGIAWTADADAVNRASGITVGLAGATQSQQVCEVRRVWCCAYQ